ncbi:MAG: alpha/beta fold hydrolase [Candidatus Krumholzibacteria bacterium]|nr:alpha/beta fold hydrolase [Candidatus Krumholzibacteria bacterium]
MKQSATLRWQAVREAVFPALAVCALAVAGCGSEPPLHLMGAYRFPDGRLVGIRGSSEGTLRYRIYETGESGRLHPAGGLRFVAGPGFSAGEPVEVTVEFSLGPGGIADSALWSFRDGPAVTLERVTREEQVRFTSGDVELFGVIDLPPGPGPHPGVVFAHGSGKDPAVEFLAFGDFLSQHGIASLTFDKRGTGRSEGEYTMDFDLLAGDVAAAVEFLASRPEIDGGMIGISGFSQGGWVGPLAASRTPLARWVIVNYGMIESPAYEARMETLDLLRGRGVAGEDLAKADTLTVAAVEIVAGGFRDGWERWSVLRKRYGGEPWMKKFKGSPVGELLKYPRWLVRLIGPMMAPPDLSWHYDSQALLESLDIPMVWMIAGRDREAPNGKTIETLRRLIAAGKPYELIVFPDADHGMLEFDEREDGRRVYKGFSRDYFTISVDRARRLSGLEPDRH